MVQIYYIYSIFIQLVCKHDDAHVRQDTKEQRAVKIVSRDSLEKDQEETMIKITEKLLKLKHPSIAEVSYTATTIYHTIIINLLRGLRGGGMVQGRKEGECNPLMEHDFFFADAFSEQQVELMDIHGFRMLNKQVYMQTDFRLVECKL